MEIISQFEHAVRHAQLTLRATGFDSRDVQVYVDRSMWEKVRESYMLLTFLDRSLTPP